MNLERQVDIVDYATIPILNAAARCSIRISGDTGKVETAVRCPFCDDKRRHLHLNTVKNVYYCHRCGEFGNSITLYSKLIGCTNRQAYAELIADCVPDPHSTVQEREPAPLEQRHAVYTAMLSLITLSEQHRQNLLQRGLDIHAIEQNGYRTMPDKAEAERVTRILSDCYDLTGIPGFYKADGKWSMITKQGIIIPVRNEAGLIQGLQIRLNNEQNGKYCWFSSHHLPQGTKSRSWLHVAGNGKLVYLVEGALKADISAHLQDNALFIGLPGVHSQQNEVVRLLKSMNITSVIEACDADKNSNINVANAVAELKRKLSEASISCQSLTWDIRLNGYDEWLQFCRYLDTAV